ncbi:MAG TPA: LytTR family DNA-binding domain-containing protein, partial [Steroidobacteraceae bacterium]|nr:LytTR family DNA-binding domain-containing protein [Steroidobacteraceae bacterium]
IDYLLKPFTPARLAAAVARVRARIHHTAPDSEALPRSTGEGDHANRGPLRWITVAQGRVVRFISVDDVCYFKADNKYTNVVTATAQSLISRTIKELLTELDQDVFLQIHRSTIVNVHRIAAIHRDLRGRLEVQLKDRRETLQVSASFAHVFKRM